MKIKHILSGMFMFILLLFSFNSFAEDGFTAPEALLFVETVHSIDAGSAMALGLTESPDKRIMPDKNELSKEIIHSGRSFTVSSEDYGAIKLSLIFEGDDDLAAKSHKKDLFDSFEVGWQS